jgi:hypothetical protein
MKKIIVLTLGLLAFTGAFAKKVKFSVNMKNEVVSVNGVHITGDFQDEAGFPVDWDPGTTAMTRETADTNIWSVVLNLPPFAKYEYKFVNGIFGYEIEFVPLESRVNTTSNDNRWIYIDSLSSDTQRVAAVLFAGNAPQGQYLLRFKVNMTQQSITSAGVHVAGDFQSAPWSTTRSHMWSFDMIDYEYIAYVDTEMSSFQHEYKFLQDTSIYEMIDGWCPLSTNGNRWVVVPHDTVLASVCYGHCASCAALGMSEWSGAAGFSVYPNPMSGQANVVFYTSADERTVRITDVQGREVMRYENYRPSSLKLEKGTLEPGIYFISVSSAASLSTVKLIVN